MQFRRTQVASFQKQTCSLTLRDAIDEFYQINAAVFDRPQPGSPWYDLMSQHDVTHVVFGVNTSVLDEAAGDFWTLFATDMSLQTYMAYASSPQGRQLIKDVGVWKILGSIVFGLPSLVRIAWRARAMSIKWTLGDYQRYLDVPLDELRAQFNVQILPYSS